MAGHAHASASAARLNLERKAFLDLLRMTNELVEPLEIARQLVVVAQHISGCEAVAIRLKSGPDFPYAASLGFPERFIRLEGSLCARDEDGHLLRDEQRNPILACVCGKVLAGQTDPGSASFTTRGSFITASTSALLDDHDRTEHLGHTRNRCHLAGFETVGLFPIRRDGVTYGLIQCNDSRPGRLTAHNLDLLEQLASSAAHLFQQAMA